MRVFIAEKPSLGKAIAAVLPGPQKRHKTHIESGEGNVVVWCAGHILEQYMPEDYDEANKNWSLESLPIIPEAWQLKVSPRTRELYLTIKKYAGQATMIVHAGDPDREGQLLVDEVLEQLDIDVPVKRILISDLNPPAVRKALSTLKNNQAFSGLRDAALGRGRADWLLGLNLTRLYTLQGKAGGHSGVLSVGRVQSPVLGLVVQRDLDIEAFTSKAYFGMQAKVSVAAGSFMANWVPGENAQNDQDEQGRVINRAFVEQLVDRLQGSGGQLLSVVKKARRNAPPLPFSLPELQKMAAKGRGLSPKKTLEIAQSLYEKHKLLTYPRSDCQYLPLEHWGQAAEVRDAVAQSIGTGHGLTPMIDQVDLIHRGKCWNDKKVTAHHAIIPTPKWAPLESLSSDERWVYEAVALRYLLQFCIDQTYDQTDVLLKLETVTACETFKARGRVETEAGWKRWQGVLRTNTRIDQEGAKGEREDTETSVDLPALTAREAVRCDDCQVQDKSTSPPKRFTEASLLDAMTGIARFVEDPEIKAILKETDGLGTPATQATIIDTLYRRGFVEKQNKQVVSTPLGRDLIKHLPKEVTLPDMTALWEQRLALIAEGRADLKTFLSEVSARTTDLVEAGVKGGALVLEGATSKAAPAVHDCPDETCDGRLRRIKSKTGFFWGCTNYASGCRVSRPDTRGKPGRARSSNNTDSHPCPGQSCDGRLRRIKGGKGYFWGCTHFGSGCKETRPDSRGKPGKARKPGTTSKSAKKKNYR